MPSLAHKDDYYETPQWLFDNIEMETQLSFNVDACANMNNSKCSIYHSEEENALDLEWWKGEGYWKPTIWCNPPRSKNGKFVNKVYEQWQKHDLDIVMLLCWNDMGNKYGEKIFADIVSGDIIAKNLGKVIFDKNGQPSEFPSRLTYLWAWFKHNNI